MTLQKDSWCSVFDFLFTEYTQASLKSTDPLLNQVPFLHSGWCIAANHRKAAKPAVTGRHE
jgi:hypothetical protein